MHIDLQNSYVMFEDEGHVTYIAHSTVIFLFATLYVNNWWNIGVGHVKFYRHVHLCALHMKISWKKILSNINLAAILVLCFYIYVNNSWNISGRNFNVTHMCIYVLCIWTLIIWAISQAFIIWQSYFLILQNYVCTSWNNFVRQYKFYTRVSVYYECAH